MITLRKLEPNNWSHFAKWWRDRDLIKMTSGDLEPLSDDEIKKQVQQMADDADSWHWMIQADDKIVGHINLNKLDNQKAELQIVIGEKEYWGRGIGKKAVELVLASAKKLNHKEIYVEVRPENQRARNLYKSAGFIEKGIKKYRNKYLPEVVMMTKNL